MEKCKFCQAELEENVTLCPACGKDNAEAEEVTAAEETAAPEAELTAEEAEKITFFAYEELLAFKRACQTLGLTKQDVEDVMYNNAMNMIEDARKSIYGE